MCICVRCHIRLEALYTDKAILREDMERRCKEKGIWILLERNPAPCFIQLAGTRFRLFENMVHCARLDQCLMLKVQKLRHAPVTSLTAAQAGIKRLSQAFEYPRANSMCPWPGHELSPQSGLEKRKIPSSPLCCCLGVGEDTIVALGDSYDTPWAPRHYAWRCVNFRSSTAFSTVL